MLIASSLPIIGTAIIYSFPPTPSNKIGLLFAFYCTQFYLAEGNLIFSLLSRNVAGQTKKSTSLTITFVAWAAGNMTAPQVGQTLVLPFALTDLVPCRSSETQTPRATRTASPRTFASTCFSTSCWFSCESYSHVATSRSEPRQACTHRSAQPRTSKEALATRLSPTPTRLMILPTKRTQTSVTRSN